MITSLRIVNGYLEINYSDGYVHLSLPYCHSSVYATPEVMARVNQYHRQNPDPFKWPDMFYNEAKAIWENFNEVSLEKSNEIAALERFVLYCREKQNDR